jgi:hypothetical protein
MPITIGVQGGATLEVARAKVRGIASEKALESLQQIKTHLSQPGRDSGVLTLFNRTKTEPGSQMTLERKGWYQLFPRLFHKDKERLDDTRDALRTMLGNAGLHDALAELDDYLLNQGGHRNQIESGKMVEILDRYLPLHTGSTFEDLLTNAKVKRVQELGSGSYGKAFLVKVDGKECVLKRFKQSQLLSLTRSGSGRSNEAIGSYLTSKNYPDYLLRKVNIAQPTFYMVTVPKGNTREYQMVNPRAMRSLVRRSNAKCHGLVMPKAKGREVGKLIEQETLTHSEKKQFVKSTLQSIKGLNERGFVHRDIKPENSYFDRETGKTTLIDTGSLFKSSKDQVKHPGTEYLRSGFGTPLYVHPRAVRSENHGTETDLYSFGLMALEVDHPKAFNLLGPEIANQNRTTPDGVTIDWLQRRLDLEINRAQPGQVKNDLVALREDMDNPGKLSGFAMHCITMAGLPAEKWKDRDNAQQVYSQLGHLDRLQ